MSVLSHVAGDAWHAVQRAVPDEDLSRAELLYKTLSIATLAAIQPELAPIAALIPADILSAQGLYTAASLSPWGALYDAMALYILKKHKGGLRG